MKLHVEEEMEGMERNEEISVVKRLETSGWCFMEDIQGIIGHLEKYGKQLLNFDTLQMNTFIKNDPRIMLNLDYVSELKSFLGNFEKRLLIVAETKTTNGRISDEMGEGIKILGNMEHKMEEKMDQNKVRNLKRVIKEKQEKIDKLAMEIEALQGKEKQVQIDKLAMEIEALQGILAYPAKFKEQMGHVKEKAIMAKKCENIRDKFDKDQLRVNF
jgi:hypothetical protein